MAVLAAARSCPRAEVVTVPVTVTGAVDIDMLASVLAQERPLACVQVANAEVGTRQPLAEVHRLCRAAGIPLVSDATQVAGHDAIGSNWDALIAVSPRLGGERRLCGAGRSPRYPVEATGSARSRLGGRLPGCRRGRSGRCGRRIRRPALARPSATSTGR